MTRLHAGLSAVLTVTCPTCGSAEEVEFDNRELQGATQILWDCEDCGRSLSAHLDALVQTEGEVS